MMRCRERRALDEDLGLESRRDGVGHAVHHRAIGEERERPAPGRGDEFDELFDDRRFGARVVAPGEVVRHVEQRVRGVVEGTVEVLDRRTGEAEILGQGVGDRRAGEDRGDVAPEVVGESRTDVDQRDLDVDLAVALGDEQQLADADVVDAREVVGEVNRRTEGADLPRLGVGAVRDERAKPLDERDDEFVGPAEFSRTVFVESGQFVAVVLDLE